MRMMEKQQQHQQQQSLRSSPQHMLTNSILIQTDDGRKYDSSIQYNRIIDNDQYTRHHHKSTKPVLGLCLVVSMFVILIMSEHFGFSSFPLVVTDSKFHYIRGNKPNIGNSYNNNNSSNSIDNGSINHEGGEYNSSDIIDALVLADDDLDDELIGNDDDEEIQQDVSRDNEEDDIDEVDNQQKMEIQTNVTNKGDYIIDLKDTDTDIIDEVVKATNQPIVVLKKVANNTMNEIQEVAAANIVNELFAEEGIDIDVHKTNVTGESSSKQNISDSVSYNDTLNIDDEQSEGSYDTSTRVYTGADDYQRTDINEDELEEHNDTNIDDETDDSKDENNQYQEVESMSIVDHRSQHETTKESVDDGLATQVKVTDQHDNYRYAAAPNYDDDNT